MKKIKQEELIGEEEFNFAKVVFFIVLLIAFCGVIVLWEVIEYGIELIKILASE